MKIEPVTFEPFSEAVFKDLQNHIKEVRRCFDWPGIPYHDAAHPVENKFNRWFWHNMPLLKKLHNSHDFIKLASKLAGRELKPSYAFLSMYGPEGVCPRHQDRPQCQFTIDLCINSDGEWPIYVDDRMYVSKPGHALAYSGTEQPHFRKAMKEDSRKHQDETSIMLMETIIEAQPITFMDLAFFHFVPIEWAGELG